MWEAFIDMFTSGEIWSIVIKSLFTAAAGSIIAVCGTALGKFISNNKESKVYKYAKTLVEAAEQKFPNEGKKMGPQKMDYVMSQIVIRFPSIKDNRYLYNIVEQAVYKLNDEKQKNEKEYNNVMQQADTTIDNDNNVEVNESIIESNTEEISVVKNRSKERLKRIRDREEVKNAHHSAQKQNSTQMNKSGGLKSF